MMRILHSARQAHSRAICSAFSARKQGAHIIWNMAIQIWAMRLTARSAQNLQSPMPRFTPSAATARSLWVTASFIQHCRRGLKSMFASLTIWVGDVSKTSKTIRAQTHSAPCSAQETRKRVCSTAQRLTPILLKSQRATAQRHTQSALRMNFVPLLPTLKSRTEPFCST